MHRGVCCLTLLLLTTTTVQAADKAKPATATAPTTSPAKLNSLPTAIAALSQEFKSGKLREKCEYFGKTPPPDLTPESVLQTLERPIPGAHRNAEAYVKWQLLSGVPGKFTDDLARRALALYRRSPAPAEHPGLDHRQLDRTIGPLRKEELGAANKEFAALVHNVNQANRPLLEFRAALFERLPADYFTLEAGLADLRARAVCGLKSDKFFDTVAAGIRSWAIGAKTSQLNAVGEALYDLKATTEQRENRPYTQIYEDKGYKWRSDYAVDPRKLDALLEFLKQAANSPTGGLKFKGEKK
jgi:hypothetical protein